MPINIFAKVDEILIYSKRMNEKKKLQRKDAAFFKKTHKFLINILLVLNIILLLPRCLRI